MKSHWVVVKCFRRYVLDAASYYSNIVCREKCTGILIHTYHIYFYIRMTESIQQIGSVGQMQLETLLLNGFTIKY